MPRIHINLIFLMAIFCLPACGQQTFDEKVKSLYNNTVPLIYANELDTITNPALVILDTREAEEYDVSHLKGAQLISYDQFEKEKVAQIPKDVEIVVYCSVGYRSERIGEMLLEMGYTNVRNLYGGIFDWKNTNHPIYNSNNQPTDSVHTYNKSWSQWLYKGIKVYE